MIFLSIGYATCHWCHVMEEESFEDLEVAKTLNDNFISIKVDREVLPDVDAHFMQISQLLTGGGGWPLNVVLTPEADGFYAGTYFPKNNLINVLTQLQNLWQTDKKRIINQAKVIKNTLRHEKKIQTALPTNLQHLAVSNLLQGFDEFYGGFGIAPKFPHESSLLLLINEQLRNPSADKLTAITTTLDTMASGGIYDVVGGGFHRYSVDEKWLVPHFEKMLYNQAQLANVYAKAYQLTNKYLYKRITEQILDYTIHEMQNGGFYSATDADSDGEEGLFFIWTPAQLQKILGKDFTSFTHYFDLSSASHFEGQNIIRYQNINTIKPQEFIKIDKMLAKLYDVREHRNKPLLDNKILLSWNALLLKSFVIAAQTIDKKYLSQAKQLADFLLTFYQNHKLQRVSIDGEVSQTAIFEDYAYFADGLIALFDATDDKQYLDQAQILIDQALTKFWDMKNHAFNTSNNKFIKTKLKEIYDGAIASSNGVAYGVLNKLAKRLQANKYQKLAQELIISFGSQINKNPSSYSTIIRYYNNDKFGTLAKTLYVYDGKLKITINNNNLILNIADGWHINAHQTQQKDLIATTLSGTNLKDIIYPKAILKNLGFSDEKIAIYQDSIAIKWTNKNNNPVLGELNLQACSDKVCLPPKTVSILLGSF